MKVGVLQFGNGVVLAGETVRPSARTTPLPNCKTPTFIASEPKYSVWYFVMRVTAKFLRMPKPSSVREPLPSIPSTKSCLAMQTSSPVHGCTLHSCLAYLKSEFGVGHFPNPRVGINT